MIIILSLSGASTGTENRWMRRGGCANPLVVHDHPVYRIEYSDRKSSPTRTHLVRDRRNNLRLVVVRANDFGVA